jgi:hypothetical protein
MKRIALVAATVLGLYLTGRAVKEFFVIHWGNPESYRNDWGGPSLAGVLAVHCLPGLILPGYLAWRIWHSPAASDPAASDPAASDPAAGSWGQPRTPL